MNNDLCRLQGKENNPTQFALGGVVYLEFVGRVMSPVVIYFYYSESCSTRCSWVLIISPQSLFKSAFHSYVQHLFYTNYTSTIDWLNRLLSANQWLLG